MVKTYVSAQGGVMFISPQAQKKMQSLSQNISNDNIVKEQAV